MGSSGVPGGLCKKNQLPPKEIEKGGGRVGGGGGGGGKERAKLLELDPSHSSVVLVLQRKPTPLVPAVSLPLM